tara:strand:- start:5480 stop:5638 length:159 start_codon:yes stop_codon:yes gene_type:complete
MYNDVMNNSNHLFKENRSLKYIAQWDEKKSDIVFKEIKDKDFYKKRNINEQT